MVHSLFDLIIPMGGGKLIWRIHVHSAQSVHDFHHRSKIHLYIIGNINSVKIFQSLHGLIYAVDPRMGKLVPLLSRNTWDRYIIISGSGGKKYLMLLWIYRYDHIHLASVGSSDVMIIVSA